MGRTPCCSKQMGLNKGPWTAIEDTSLIQYIQSHGEGHWRSLPEKAGLRRCGKSCRLRWRNYLRPDIKRGNITPDEEDLIMRLHALLGNRWSLIAGRLPDRTDNEIKNYWNSHLSKKINNNTEPGGASSRNGKAKIKVHQPKAIRVTPSSFINNLPQLADHVPEASNGLDDTEALVCDDVKAFDDFVHGCSQVNYEEYEQILLNADEDHDDAQLDSFVNSLLV